MAPPPAYRYQAVAVHAGHDFPAVDPFENREGLLVGNDKIEHAPAGRQTAQRNRRSRLKIAGAPLRRRRNLKKTKPQPSSRKTVREPVAALPPQSMASPTRPAGRPLIKTVGDPTASRRGCGGAGHVGQACGA